MKPTKKQISEVMSELGKRGGNARAKKLTHKEMEKIARKGAAATNRKRWGARRKKKAKKSLDRQATGADSESHGASVKVA